MSSVGGFVPGRLWGLLEMLELKATTFVAAVGEMRALITLIKGFQNKSEAVSMVDRETVFTPHLGRLLDALEGTGARSALASANRLKAKIGDPNVVLSHHDIGLVLADIESRFGDHLSDIKLFVLNEQEASMFEPADRLLSFSSVPIEGFSRAFPSASFEIEEACKCIALGRHTACVFHCMRSLERAIRALCKLLEIPDPTKPAEKNWGTILDAIKKRIDEKWPKNKRMSGSEGAQLEALYVTLDAIKNPWRNAAMHVESVYAPHDALHIARCTGMFLVELMKHCDESGIPLEASPAKATVGEEPTSAVSVSIPPK
jgi:hypothetical protein